MITIWHNPRCSKSRQTLALVEAAGVPFTVRKYLEDPPTVPELAAVLSALGDIPALQLVRTGEARFKELALGKEASSDALLAAMAAHPILIERPVVISGSRAILGRPPENVTALL